MIGNEAVESMEVSWSDSLVSCWGSVSLGGLLWELNQNNALGLGIRRLENLQP